MGKFYAVKNGRNPGIYNTWEECKLQVEKFPNAIFKSFKTKLEAEAFMDIEKNKLNEEKEHITIDANKDFLVSYVDGSYNIKTKTYGYGAIVFHNNEKLSFSDSGSSSKYADLRNVAGEVFGAIKVIQYALDVNKNIKIYYDYTGIENWGVGRWKTNTELTQKYADFVKQALKTIDIEFVKVKSHSGIEFNEEVDKLAKMAVGL